MRRTLSATIIILLATESSVLFGRTSDVSVHGESVVRMTAMELSGVTSPCGTADTLTISCGSGAAADQAMTSTEETENIAVNVTVGGLEIERSGNFLKIGFEMNLSGLKVRSSRAVLLTPHLVFHDGGNRDIDSLEFPTVGIYGRQRYYFHLRNRSRDASDEQSYMERRRPETLSFSRVVERPQPRDGGVVELRLRMREYACCGVLTDESDVSAGRYAEAALSAAVPSEMQIGQTLETCPQMELKPAERHRYMERSLSGTAYIDYRTDRSRIEPDYRDNRDELRKIDATIDSLKALGSIVNPVGDSTVTVTDTENNAAIRITRVMLKGYASPEGRYGHNAELAMARAAALRDYIRQLYRFGDGVVEISVEPEDWEGLRRMVMESNLPHRDQILRMIDAPEVDPDVREWKIKSGYPEDYRFMLENFYPDLRRTDYEIFYIVREVAGPETGEAKPGNNNEL